MSREFKDVDTLCSLILRNGFDAYVINARYQNMKASGGFEVDIATDMSFDYILKLFPRVKTGRDDFALAEMKDDDIYYRFYPTDVVDASHPEEALVLLTPRLLDKITETENLPPTLTCRFMPRDPNPVDSFADFSSGFVRFLGLPDETLKRNYLLGFKALRYAANYNLPIEPNSWMAIVRSAQRMLDYISISDIMDEFKRVEAENLSAFVRMLFDAQILHSLIPEVAALKRVVQHKEKSDELETVFDHTLEVMNKYPEELPYDWFGTMACLFHDVGKLYTAEYADERWAFPQHSHIGSKITRKILNRFRFTPEDIDLVCHLVRHHMRFNYMLTDTGILRFKALDEYPRLIEITRANIKARNGNYAAFNLNLKNLERAATPGEMTEALLNGNEIMDFTGLKPGPAVGVICEALLKSQIAGEVTSIPEAVEFVIRYHKRENLA